VFTVLAVPCLRYTWACLAWAFVGFHLTM
jgi:hypothetical protein